MNKKLVICIISLIIIVIGVIMALKFGFNQSFEYSDYTRILVYMIGESNLDDINQIMKDNFDGTYKVSYTDEFKDTVSIIAKRISDEQINNINDKLKEKYEFDENLSNIVIINTPSIDIYDIVKDYIRPVVISFVIVIVYLWIAYRKEGLVKALVEPCLTIIIINALYISILAIFRIPVNSYTLPAFAFIYAASVVRCNNIFKSKI